MLGWGNPGRGDDGLGPALAADVDALLMRERALPPGDGPDLQGATPLMRRVVAQMRDTLETPMPLERLARALGVSTRRLHRETQAAFATSPGALYRHLRLSSARSLVENTELGIAEIAVRCGYENPSALARAFKARFGLPPQVLRAQMSRNRH